MTYEEKDKLYEKVKSATTADALLLLQVMLPVIEDFIYCNGGVSVPGTCRALEFFLRDVKGKPSFPIGSTK